MTKQVLVGAVLVMLAVGTREAEANVLDLSVGNEQTCAISSIGGTSGGGKVYCWGGNGYGQLGVGDTLDYGFVTSPIIIGGSAITDFIQVKTGAYHTCGLRAGGTVVCWGYNQQGQLGRNTTSTGESTGATVLKTGGTTLTGVKSISAGAWHTCASIGTPGTDNTVSCWGWNGEGELGDGTQTSRSVATATANASWGAGVTSTSVPIQVAAGYDHTCALVGPGQPYHNPQRLWCWGRNQHGEVGNNSTAMVTSPVELTSGTLFGKQLEGIFAGFHRTYALCYCGSDMRWGVQMPYGESGGELHVPTAISAPFVGGPVAYYTSLMTDFTVSQYGSSSAIGLWSGSNGSGQLGDGTFTACSSNSHCALYSTELFGVGPIAVAWNGFAGAEHFMAGAGALHACAVDYRQPANVWCWGLGNNGRLGNYTNNNPQASPIIVKTTGGVTANF